jgi:hypothetical protein
MPNPRNRLKLTGDTRLPDVGDLGDDVELIEEEVVVLEVATPQEESAAMAPMREHTRRRGMLDAAREQVRAKPVAALAGAFVLGLLLARI